MTLIRWNPAFEIDTLRRQMDQIFDEMAGLNRETQYTWQPAIEIKDTETSVILRAEIPGVEGKDLDVRVTPKAVAIAGEHRYQKTEDKGLFRTELRYGKFQRVIPLPVAVVNDQVQAEFKNGILTLTLPKVSEARNQVVKINLVDTNSQTDATQANQAQEANQAETTQEA